MSNTRSSETAGPHLSIDVISGLVTGMICSGLFNPWDRALYLSVVKQRPFLSFENFTHPYQGFSQAVIQRAFLGSVYFIIQGQLNTRLHPYLHKGIGMSEPSAQFCIGLLAGSMNGMLTNSISATKYHTWRKSDGTFLSSISDMWVNGGYKPFFKGTAATVSRDAVFGSTYEVLRHLLYAQTQKLNNDKKYRESQLKFVSDTLAGGIATIASGPFNYARSIQYATPADQPSPSMTKVLSNIWQESKNHSHQSFGRFYFFQDRFKFGWGSARVAFNMSFGQFLFGAIRSKLMKIQSKESPHLKSLKG